MDGCVGIFGNNGAAQGSELWSGVGISVAATILGPTFFFYMACVRQKFRCEWEFQICSVGSKMTRGWGLAIFVKPDYSRRQELVETA